MADAENAWPLELKLGGDGTMLAVAFEDGRRFTLPAEYLRVLSPSAEVKGHSRKERKIVGGKRQVAIIGIEPVGSYAVKLAFDDMHASGIYTWSYLYELGRDLDDRWRTYLAELEEKGLSRDKVGEIAVGEH